MKYGNASAGQRKCFQLSENDRLSEKQYAAIADLIYETDPFIYPAMFGHGTEGRRRAALLLPAVFEAGQDTMFAKRNLFVAEEQGEIIGLILWHRGRLLWDTKPLLDIAARNNVALTEENVENVKREYVDSSYADGETARENGLFVINVCVKKEKRGISVGHDMLESFLQTHNNEKIELTVLADNDTAVRLYRKCGFRIVRQEDGFSETSQKVPCFVMQRQP